MNVHKGWAFPLGIFSEVHSPITTPEIICVMALTLQPIRGCPQHSGEMGTRLSLAIHRHLLSRFFLREGGRLYTDYQTLIWRLGDTVQNLYSPGLSPRVDSTGSMWKWWMDRVINRSSSCWNLWIDLLQTEAKPVKNASSLLLFSSHSEFETGPRIISKTRRSLRRFFLGINIINKKAWLSQPPFHCHLWRTWFWCNRPLFASIQVQSTLWSGPGLFKAGLR